MWLVCRADNPTSHMCQLSCNLEASTSWNPQGLSMPVMGLLYLLQHTNENTVWYCSHEPIYCNHTITAVWVLPSHSTYDTFIENLIVVLNINSYFTTIPHYTQGTQWCSWLWQCATSQVTSLIPNGVRGVFHWHNPSGCTMALRFDSASNTMRTGNIVWEVKAAGAEGWQPYHLQVPTVSKFGGLNFMEPSGPVTGLHRGCFTFYPITHKHWHITLYALTRSSDTQEKGITIYAKITPTPISIKRHTN